MPTRAGAQCQKFSLNCDSVALKVMAGFWLSCVYALPTLSLGRL